MTEFDPNQHLTNLKGAPYLEVKWRMAWLRDKHPDAAIDTDMVSMNEQHAIFKATVSIPGGGSATGWGSETPGDFRDYIEKAETKALGRALAALGFGTQFAPDVDDGSAHDRPVDSPVRRQDAPQRHEAPLAVSGDPTILSPKQLGMIRGLAKQKGIKSEALEARCSQLFSVPVERLSRRDASDLIKKLEAVPDKPEDGPPADDNDSDNDSANQAMIDDFNAHYPPSPDLAAKHRQ